MENKNGKLNRKLNQKLKTANNDVNRKFEQNKDAYRTEIQ